VKDKQQEPSSKKPEKAVTSYDLTAFPPEISPPLAVAWKATNCRCEGSPQAIMHCSFSDGKGKLSSSAPAYTPAPATTSQYLSNCSEGHC
jgi:hypothetical protein